MTKYDFKVIRDSEPLEFNERVASHLNKGWTVEKLETVVCDDTIWHVAYCCKIIVEKVKP